MGRAFDNPPTEAGLRDCELWVGRPSKLWVRTPVVEPQFPCVAEEASRSRAPPTVLDQDAMECIVGDKKRYSKLQTVNVEFTSALAGFEAITCSNVHVNNHVAREKNAARIAFMDRLSGASATQPNGKNKL